MEIITEYWGQSYNSYNRKRYRIVKKQELIVIIKRYVAYCWRYIVYTTTK